MDADHSEAEVRNDLPSITVGPAPAHSLDLSNMVAEEAPSSSHVRAEDSAVDLDTILAGSPLAVGDLQQQPIASHANLEPANVDLDIIAPPAVVRSNIGIEGPPPHHIIMHPQTSSINNANELIQQIIPQGQLLMKCTRILGHRNTYISSVTIHNSALVSDNFII